MTNTITYAVAPSSLGWVLVATSAQGICAVLLGDSPPVVTADLESRFPDSPLVEENLGFVSDVIALIEEPRRQLDATLDMRGTDLQRRVWDELRRIPVGSTVSYGEIAARIAAPRGAKDVADACAANSLAVVIPCHRVIRSNGALAGYRWGVRRKRALLAREARA